MNNLGHAVINNMLAEQNGATMKWNMSDAISMIEIFVKENQSLTEIKEYFFGDDEINADTFDIIFVENVYEEKFIELLPEKGKHHITKMFEDRRWKKIHIWFEGIYLEKFTVFQCFEKTKSPFFDALQNIDITKVNQVFAQIQSYFQSKFLESKSLNIQFRLYQSLIKCDAKTELSQKFIDSLKSLEKQLKIYSERMCLIPETEIIHNEHQIFANLIDLFIPDQHDSASLKLLIEKLYKNSFTIFRENGDKVFEITGRQIKWSNIKEMFGKDCSDNSISQLRLSARHLLILDSDIIHYGKSLSLISPKVIIQNFVTCNLSGFEGIEHLIQKAENGTERNKNGEKGKDGFDGESSGSMVICTSEIINAKNLHIILNGGKGSKGQDGGSGFDGTNGVGKRFKKAFGFRTKLRLKTAAIGNVIFGGLPGILRARYKETTEQNEVEANDGKDGEAGKEGENGIDGKDGWDVACIQKSFGKLRKYGKFNNEKLEIIFTNKADNETVYVKSKDTGKRSQCYAKIIAKPLIHSLLKEKGTKKMERMTTETQTKKININSAEKTFKKLCILETDTKADQILEVHRIKDRSEYPIYIPKYAIKPLNTLKETIKNKQIWFEKSMVEFESKYASISDSFDELVNLVKPLIDKLLKFLNAKTFYNCLELMYFENVSIVADFVISLLANFEVDGCRIDFGIFKYLLEILFSSIKKNETFKFSIILLSKDQSEWIDAFFLQNVQMTLNLQESEKAMIQESLKTVLDENLKFVCSKWFRRFPLDFQQFMAAVKSMENVLEPTLVGDKTPLTEWPKALKFSKINSNLSISEEDSEDIKFAKFWCSKLSSFFSFEEIEETFKLLSTQKNISDDKENIGRLVHRLCIYDFVAGDFNPREDPTVKYLINEVFACYFGIPLSIKSKTYAVAKEVIEQFRFEISNTTEASNCLEKVWDQCCKSVPFILEKDSSISDSLCNELFEKFVKNGEKWDMEDFQNQIAETQKLKLKDFDICLLKFVGKVISHKFNVQLRINQKIAILTAIRGQHSKGILQQLPTGNGKSLIIVVCSIILTWKRHTVNIVTSSSVLAKRDVLLYSEYYKTFGIKVNHICDESPNIRSERYELNHVLYGDLSSFQRDYLLDKFYSMKITNNRAFDRIIVDEVDSLLLDQGTNMLYLSHEIPDMERLQPLFVKIWYTVRMSPTTTDDELYTLIYHNCFPSISMLNWMEILCKTKNKIKMLKSKLIQNGIINNDEDILITNCSEIDSKLEELNEPTIIQILKFIFHQIINQERLKIPFHLHKFVKFHLKEFITNAKLAMEMEEGYQYLVDTNLSSCALKYEPKIIIIDQNTGADLPSTQWSNGLQQFLQLKHGLRLTPISLKAVYISSVSYFQKFMQIYGFSGTLGSRKERKQLYDKYYVDLKLIPSSLPKLFYEEPSIVTTTKNLHIRQIFNAINSKLNENRSVLIICESIKEVDEINSAVKELAEKEASEVSPFLNATIYRRDYEKFEYGEGLKLPCKSIIFSTNLAGRGTNILLTEDLRRAGGLHVILTFLPKNLRIEEQAFGRAARSGDPGTGQLIICVDVDNSINYANVTDFLQLKFLRNAQDNLNVESDYDIYDDKVKVEEKCFEIFAKHFREHEKEMNEKDVEKIEKTIILRDLLDQWALWMDIYPNEIVTPVQRRNAAEKSYKAMKEISQQKLMEEMMSIFASLEESTPEEYKSKMLKLEKDVCNTFEGCAFKNPISEKRFAATETFCNGLSANISLLGKDYYPLTQPSNILMLAINQIEKKKFAEAEKQLKWLASKYPIYSPEAKYYLTFLAIKKSDNLTQEKIQEYKQISKEIKESRKEFDCRIFSNFIDRAIIEFYKEIDDRKVFKVDLFSQQQIENSQILSLFIESIDAILGGTLNAKSFMTTFIPEEASYLIYQYFTGCLNFDKVPIKPIKVCEEYGIQKLKEYCQKQDICFELLNAKIETCKSKDEEISEKDLIYALKLPTAENFWESLITNEILINQKQHFFVNIIKFETLNPGLTEIIKDLIIDESIIIKEDKRLFKHYFILTENWKEIDVIKMKERLKPECISILCEIGAFCETVSAELKPVYNINFASFNKLTIENILDYGIPENIVLEILNSLTNNGILKAANNTTFELSENFKPLMENLNFEIPAYLKEAVWKAINKNLAFSIAFQKLQQDLKEAKQLKIMLPLLSEYSIIQDLVDIEIFERSNTNFNALKYISKAEKPFIKTLKAKYQNVVNSNATSANVEIAAKIVKTKCRNNLKPPNIAEIKIKEYKYITSEKDKIYQKFYENASAQQRFETLNAELCLLWDILTECNLVEIRSSPVGLNDCMKYLIKLNEKKWSRKTITKLSLISIAASAQLAIGAVIMLSTAGIGAPISKYFISQGLGDIVYILKSCYTGYAEKYIQHKLISMIMGTLPGMPWIKQLISSSETRSTSSIDNVESIVINKVKNQILSASINLSITSIFHSKIDDKIKDAAASTKKLIFDIIENEIANFDQILKNIFERNISDATKNLIESCINNEHFLSKINRIIEPFCDYVFIRYRKLFIKFEPRIDKNDGEEGKDSSLLNKIIGVSIFLKQKPEFCSLCSKMEQEIENAFEELKTEIEEKLDETSEDSETFNTLSIDDTILATQFSAIIDGTINSRITNPLTALTMSKLQKNLENKVMHIFELLKINFKNNQQILPKNHFFEQNKINKIIKEENQNAIFLFEEILNDFIKITKHPITYVQIIMAGIGIDEMACKFLAKVINTKLPINLEIKYSSNRTFTYLSDDKNVERRFIDLSDEKLGSEIKTSKVFDAIINQIPALPFKNESEFKQVLIEFIKNDPDFEMNRQQQLSLRDNPMSTQEFSGLLDSVSQSVSNFTEVGGKARGSNILFLA